MRIILADDDTQVRSAIRLLLEQEPCTEIIFETDELDLPGINRADIEPDLLLLDWEIRPEPSHDEWLKQARKRWPGLKVIAMSGRPESRQKAYAAGVDAFVSKGDPPESLLEAVRALT